MDTESSVLSVRINNMTFAKGHKLRVWTKEQKRKLSRSISRDKHYRWKGGIWNLNGYILILTPRGYKRQHRLIMERYLDRKLKKIEHVHHKNGIKTDNRIANLEVINNKEHARKHAIGNKRWKFRKHTCNMYCIKTHKK